MRHESLHALDIDLQIMVLLTSVNETVMHGPILQ